MTQYHIYAIGNALVDVEIELTESDLDTLEVEKGVMTLVDKARHDDLLERVPGERHKRACGGSAANSVIGAAKLGAKTFYSCKIASDETGDFYAADLHREGVHSNLDSIERSDGHTGKCLVMITPDADRSMNTFLGITGDVGYEEVDEDSMAKSDWLYLEGYLVSTGTSRETATRAREFAQQQGIKVAMSLADPNMVRFFGDELRNMIGPKVDLLFCNREEAMLYTEADSLDAAIEGLKAVAEHFIVTLGPDGAVIWDGQQTIAIEPHSVKAVDTNGAGDMFAGAYLYGITHSYSAEKAGKLASYASSVLVTEFGPRLSPAGMEKVKQFIESELN